MLFVCDLQMAAIILSCDEYRINLISFQVAIKEFNRALHGKIEII